MNKQYVYMYTNVVNHCNCQSQDNLSTLNITLTLRMHTRNYCRSPPKSVYQGDAIHIYGFYASIQKTRKTSVDSILYFVRHRSSATPCMQRELNREKKDVYRNVAYWFLLISNIWRQSKCQHWCAIEIATFCGQTFKEKKVDSGKWGKIETHQKN